MPNVTVRVRILKAERLTNTPSGNPRWSIAAEGVLPMETEPDAQVGHLDFTGWVGQYAALTANPQDRIVHAQLLGDAPTCKCCGGHGMHEHRAYVGGRSPEDYDIECSVCSGRGITWFDARPNSCSGFRTLSRGTR